VIVVAVRGTDGQGKAGQTRFLASGGRGKQLLNTAQSSVEKKGSFLSTQTLLRYDK
jgi:hypothetical protein